MYNIVGGNGMFFLKPFYHLVFYHISIPVQNVEVFWMPAHNYM